MKTTKLIVTFLFLLVTMSLSAQRVYYKGDYYTLVNSKIFHLGHNVYGKLTAGQRDTIYMIARELYDEKGKLKEEYKHRRKRDRYKLPEGYWEQKKAEAAEATNNQTSAENNIGTAEKESPQESSKKKENLNVLAAKTKSQDESHSDKDVIYKEKTKKEKAYKNKHNKASEEALEKQEKLEKERQKKQQQRDKEERKQEKKLKKAEKEQKKKAKELKQKERAIDKYEDAERKLKKAEKKYKKLKEKGELSPNDEVEWLEKISKLKETVEKTRKKAKKA